MTFAEFCLKQKGVESNALIYSWALVNRVTNKRKTTHAPNGT